METTTTQHKRPFQLNTDLAPWYQGEQLASMVINGVANSNVGDYNTLSSEPGNTSCYALPSGYTPIGHINLNNNEVVVFSTNGTNSEIGIAISCNYTTLVNNTCLDFSEDTPIRGTFRMRNGCERNIYWVDGTNPDRHIDIDNLRNYWTSAYETWYDGGQVGPAPDPQWDCDAMTLSASFQMASINDITVEDAGGSMPIGTCRLGFRYKDESGNTTPVFLISRPIVIYDENVSSDYDNITGGYDEASGFLDFVTSSKTITVELEDVDTSYNSIELIAVHYISGDGVTTTSYIVDSKAIGNNTNWTYTYTGPNSASTTIDLAELQVDPIVYPTSKTIHQFDNRLVRGNVKTSDIDWKEFQKKANEITTLYLATENDAYDQTSDSNAKHPACTRSFMSDEIYSFGIRWILKDGTFGPVLHIPGRVADTDARINITTGNSFSHIRNQVPGGGDWDTQSLSVVSSITDATTQVLEEDVAHLGLSAGGNVERWKVFNTAQPTSGGTPLVGIMGYHESANTYPDTRDCDGAPIYPHTDNGGGSYTMHNIRHHRMPDANLVHPFDGNDLRYIGATFSNIAPPTAYSDDVQGYEILMANPERTVLSKGLWTYALHRIDISDNPLDIYYQPMPFYQDTSLDYRNNSEYALLAAGGDNSGKQLDMGVFVSPDFRYANEFPNGTHVKFEGVVTGDTEVVQSTSGSPSYVNCSWKSTWNSFGNPTCANRKIDDQLALGFDRVFEGFSQSDWIIDNRGEQQEVIFQKISDDIVDYGSTDTVAFAAAGTTHANYVLYASIKNTKDVYSNLESLSYESLTDAIIDSSTTVSIIDRGDTIVAPFTHKKTVNSAGSYDNLSDATLFREEYTSSFSVVPVESRTNFSLAHESATTEILYKNATEEEFLEATIEDRDDDGNDESHFDEHTTLYNPDMLVREQIKRGFGVYDTDCSSCSNCFPNMIVYSGVASQDNIDAYKVTLANNFTQVEGTSGDITGLFSIGRSFFVRTEQSLFEQIPSATSLKAEANNVYLGTGEFFSLPAKEIIKTHYGYGGSQDRFDLLETQYGVFYVDRMAGKAYQMINGQLTPISDKGMTKWFKKRLPSQVIQEVYSQGHDFPLKDAICSDNGLGTQLVYDPYHERIIIHVKDYYPLFTWSIYDSSLSYNEGDHVYDTSDGKFYFYDQSVIKTGMILDQQDKFENRSWSISYDPKTQSWIGFHSYHPTWSYNDSVNYFSYLDNQNYKHETDAKFTNYFGVKYPFILEVARYSPNATTLESLEWNSEITNYNSSREQHVDIPNVTFNDVIAYTRNRSTGNLDITVDTGSTYQTGYSQSETIAEQTDEGWATSRFRDQLSSYSDPMFTSSWDDTEYKSHYNSNGQGFYDKVPYTSAYSTSKNQHELAMLRDKYHYTRLFYNPEQDYKIKVDHIAIKTKHSFR